MVWPTGQCNTTRSTGGGRSPTPLRINTLTFPLHSLCKHNFPCGGKEKVKNLEHTFYVERSCAGEQKQISAAVSSHAATKTSQSADLSKSSALQRREKDTLYKIPHT